MIWEVGFWGSLGVVGYVVAGFPLLVLVRGWRAPAEPPMPSANESAWPRISVIIAARNEVACIAPKIQQLLATDYPAERLEVVVASDGSVDGTDDAVRAFGRPEVHVLSLPRRGKAAALNAAIQRATGEVLVFTDANSWFEAGALRALVQPLSDPAVGGVAGDQRYGDRPADGRNDGELVYWSLDRMLKRAESRGGSTISATGAIYAVRRELVQEVPADVTDDFYISTGVVAAGRRLVFVPDAVAYEPVAASADLEFSRKVRIMTRGLTGVRRRAALLDPRRSGFYAVQLVSHKILRRLLAIPLLASMVSALALSRRGAVYRLVLAGEVAFVSAGAVGLALRERPVGRWRAFSIPGYVCMVHAAALRAGWNLARGRTITHWEPPIR